MGGILLYIRLLELAGHISRPCSIALTCLFALLLFALRSQSTGHGAVLQPRDSSFSVGHATPPYRGATFVRVRVWVLPAPQVWLHSPQLPHSPITQSTGQANTLHVSTRLTSSLHDAPPCCGLVTAGAAPRFASHVSTPPAGIGSGLAS